MTLAPKCEMMPVFGAALTSGSRGLGVRKEHDTGLALVDERLQAGLDAVIGLDLAAEAVERDDVAHLRLAGDGQAVGGGGGGGSLLSGRGRGLGRTAAGLDGLLDLFGDLGDLGLLLLGRRLRGRRGRGLALAEFDGHGCDGRGDSGGSGMRLGQLWSQRGQETTDGVAQRRRLRCGRQLGDGGWKRGQDGWKRGGPELGLTLAT